MKINSLILIVALLGSLSAFGQRRSEKATVVFDIGTQTSGYIAIRAAYAYSTGILFSTTIDGEFIEYPAARVKNFSIGELQYEQFEIDTEMRLLLYLAKGKIDLLQLEELGQTRFYIKSETKPITHLYYKETVSNGYLHKAEAYKETLTLAMHDCPAVFSKIKSNIIFNANNLLRIFKKYYECVGDANAKDNEKDKTMDVFVGGNIGLSLTDPYFRLFGASVDFVPLRKKISFMSLYYLFGAYDNKLSFNGSPYMQRRRMNNLGAKFSIVLVSLRVVEPYLVGNIGLIDYRLTNIIDRSNVPATLRDFEVRHLNIGFGAGLKFMPVKKWAAKIELSSNIIPERRVMGPSVQTLTPLTVGLAYKIN